MKKLIMIILFCRFGIDLLIGQNLFNTGLSIPYDPCTGCSENNPTNPVYQETTYFNNAPEVKSDFGPRYVVRSSGDVPYDWHGGIDYSAAPGINDRGYHLRALQGGTVREIGGGGIKYIVVDGEDHDFGYLHIFSNGIPRNNGDCYIVRLAPPHNNNFGIVIPDAATIEGFILISDCEDCTGHYYVHNGITLTATNQVEEGQIIAVLGDSGAPGNAHLHLNRYESLANGMDFVNGDANMLNPLEFVEHWNPDYEVSLHNHSTVATIPEDEPEGVVVTYPGTQPSKIMVRPRMNNEADMVSAYNAGTLNIAEVEVLMKKNHQVDWYRIKGATYEAKVTLGATVQDNTSYPNYVGVTGAINKGGWNKQGIFHFAYRDANNPHGTPYSSTGARPWDDYYFPDFITRIHKDDPTDGATTPTMISYCPMSTRYNDGHYQIKARVTDVRNGYTDSPVEDIVIDNYQPFIREVKAQIGGQVIYRRTWQCNDGGSCQGMYLENGVISDQISRSAIMSQGMWVTVTGSEPLAGLKLDVNNLINVQAVDQLEDGRIWRFFVAPAQISSILNSQTVEFKCYNATDVKHFSDQ